MHHVEQFTGESICQVSVIDRHLFVVSMTAYAAAVAEEI